MDAHARADNIANDDPETHGAHGGGYQEHHPTTKVYLVIFVVLMVLLLLAIVAGVFIGGTFGTILGFSIGAAKAVLIILYFMHVRYGTRLTWIFSGAAFLWLAVMIVFTLADYASRGRVSDRTDPIGEYAPHIVTTDNDKGPVIRP